MKAFCSAHCGALSDHCKEDDDAWLSSTARPSRPLVYARKSHAKFSFTPVSLGPKPQPSGTGGVTAGLLLTWSPPSTAKARTQFSLVCKKWRKEGYWVVDTISFVGQQKARHSEWLQHWLSSTAHQSRPPEDYDEEEESSKVSGSKLQPIRTSGTATGLFSARCPLSASQARTQFNLVHKKWHSEGYSVISTVFFVGLDKAGSSEWLQYRIRGTIPIIKSGLKKAMKFIKCSCGTTIPVRGQTLPVKPASKQHKRLATRWRDQKVKFASLMNVMTLCP
ncbi:hypothetical protein MRX96_034654 [Rhipicephalus microplus]